MGANARGRPAPTAAPKELVARGFGVTIPHFGRPCLPTGNGHLNDNGQMGRTLVKRPRGIDSSSVFSEPEPSGAGIVKEWRVLPSFPMPWLAGNQAVQAGLRRQAGQPFPYSPNDPRPRRHTGSVLDRLGDLPTPLGRARDRPHGSDTTGSARPACHQIHPALLGGPTTWATSTSR